MSEIVDALRRGYEEVCRKKGVKPYSLGPNEIREIGGEPLENSGFEDEVSEDVALASDAQA